MADTLTESELLEYLRDDTCELIKFDPNNDALVSRKAVLDSRKATILSILKSDHWSPLETMICMYRDKLKNYQGKDFLVFMLERIQHNIYLLLARLFVIESSLQKYSIERVSNIKYEDVNIVL